MHGNKYGILLFLFLFRTEKPPRAPLRPLNKDDKRILDQVIDTMNTTIDRIEKEKATEKEN